VVTVFADTSGLYALMDADDDHHDGAHAAWAAMAPDDPVVTTHLVVAETTALIQRRLGMAAATDLHQVLLRDVHTQPLTSEQFARAVERWSTMSRRQLSLVDVTSFVAMGDLDIDDAFAIDDDFTGAGFRVLIT
jgi:predicted nucleic acid-binding protein